MATPGMVAAGVAVWFEGAAEVGERECGDRVTNSQLLSCGIEGAERRAHLAEQRILRGKLSAVRVKAADRNEENLPLNTQSRSHGYDFCYLLQLAAQS